MALVSPHDVSGFRCYSLSTVHAWSLSAWRSDTYFRASQHWWGMTKWSMRSMAALKSSYSNLLQSRRTWKHIVANLRIYIMRERSFRQETKAPTSTCKSETWRHETKHDSIIWIYPSSPSSPQYNEFVVQPRFLNSQLPGDLDSSYSQLVDIFAHCCHFRAGQDPGVIDQGHSNMSSPDETDIPFRNCQDKMSKFAIWDYLFFNIYIYHQLHQWFCHSSPMCRPLTKVLHLHIHKPFMFRLISWLSSNSITSHEVREFTSDEICPKTGKMPPNLLTTWLSMVKIEY
jgi:hypothetical protein